MRKVTRIFTVLVPLGVLLGVAYWKFSSGNVDSSRLHKRDTGKRSHHEEPNEETEVDPRVKKPNVKDFNIDFEEYLPGHLICQKKKRTRSPDTLTAELDIPPDDVSERLRDETKKNGIRASLFALNPRRPKGCCPAGSKSGEMYRMGYSCCIDKVFNERLQFCCLDKGRVLEDTEENKDYCYPKNGTLFCRKSDLHMEGKEPMELECDYNERNTPIFCKFVCPSGMVQTEGIVDATCSETGVWNRQPTCCEGCPSTLTLDLWFLVEVSQDYKKDNFRHLVKFLKDSLSYLPVSQERVRVGVTIFNRVVFHDVGVWYMNKHNSHESIFRAIDEIPMEGTGVRTGAAIDWIAKNAFTESKGNRDEAQNLVVAILNGTPDDPFVEQAKSLKSISDVITIAIGSQISNDDLSVIATAPKNVYRTKNFSTLSEFNKLIYGSICGENCKTQN